MILPEGNLSVSALMMKCLSANHAKSCTLLCINFIVLFFAEGALTISGLIFFERACFFGFWFRW